MAESTIKAGEIAAEFNPLALPPDFYADPYPFYRALREHAPIKRCPDGSYFLTRYDDLVTVYKDTASYSSDKKKEFAPKYGATPLFEHHTTSLVFNDPPVHTRVRSLIAGALTPRHVAAMEAGLVVLVDRLLEALAQKGQVDLIDDFAGAIPVEIIGNLLGVPREARGPLRGWSLAILGALEPALSTEAADAGNRAVREMLGFLEMLVADRRAQPGDAETDVLTRLIQGESGGERLALKDLLHNCIFLLNAGHETTTNLIGNSLASLRQWPSELQKLRTNAELGKTAVEELLRFESSNQLGNRITTRAVTLGGIEMPPDTRLTLCIGAANRDPAQFTDPDRLDIARSPNRHLAFGYGPHMCVGMNLGRLEGRVAVTRFITRFPDYRLEDPAQRSRRARFRGFLHLPCRVD